MDDDSIIGQATNFFLKSEDVASKRPSVSDNFVARIGIVFCIGSHVASDGSRMGVEFLSKSFVGGNSISRKSEEIVEDGEFLGRHNDN